MNAHSVIKKHLRGTYLIGVSGHKDLQDKDKLKQRVLEVLKKIKDKDHQKTALLCLGADGADQLVAEVAHMLGIKVVGIYVVDYEKLHPDITEFNDNKKWLNSLPENEFYKTLYIGDGTFERRITDVAGDKEKTDSIFLEIHGTSSAAIVGCSDYVIALWDGVDTGKIGGTSEAVHMALYKKDFKGNAISFEKPKKGIIDPSELAQLIKKWRKPKGLLYHIVTPRDKNRFVLARFNTPLDIGVPNAGAYETGISAFPKIPYRGNFFKRFYKKTRNILFDSLALNYLLPLALVAITVTLGCFGFRDARNFESWKSDTTHNSGYKLQLQLLQTKSPKLDKNMLGDYLIRQYDWSYQSGNNQMQWNDVFNAINLLTFNSSANVSEEKAPLSLQIARFAGTLFVINAFLIAFFFAVSGNTIIRIKVILWTWFRREFYVIAGLNDKAFNLAKDINHLEKRVIIIEGEPNSTREADALKNNIPVFKGNSYSISSLKKIKAIYARIVFILTDDDVVNIRTVQELGQLSPWTVKIGPWKLVWRKNSNQSRYVHLNDGHYKDFVCKTNPDTDVEVTHVFNIYENTARRLLLEYPFYRFERNLNPQTAEVFVFGFGEMAEHIVLACLRSAFFNEGEKLKITIFTTNHEDKRADFFKKYPALWYDAEKNGIYSKDLAKKIRDHIFPKDLLLFKELPLSDAAYFSDETLRDAIKDDHVVSIYFCLPQSMQSAAYLHAILPKIQHLQGAVLSEIPKCDVQCFCHYNLYDKDEVAYVEHIMNNRISNSPVVFFGSFTDECTKDAILSRSDDLLPKLINFWYTKDSMLDKKNANKRKIDEVLMAERKELWINELSKNNEKRASILNEANSEWSKLSITQKESNRYAADHLWVKLKLLGYTYIDILERIKESETELNLLMTEFTQHSLTIAKLEHSRWCAEKLLEGFLPAQDFDNKLLENHTTVLQAWNDEDESVRKKYRDYYQEQKLHIDLLLFEELYKGSYDGDPLDEQLKDVGIIQAIPYLLYALKLRQD